MREVAVIGIGQTAVGKLHDQSLRDLAVQALNAAVQDAELEQKPDALFVANMLASRLNNQAHLGTLVADSMGWRGVEATTVEAACASGGSAFQAGVRAVASGMVDVAAVCGVEKMTDTSVNQTVKALAMAADAELEGIHDVTFVGLNALIMRRYMYEFNVPHEAFANFSINAHQNAVNNPNAMFRKEIAADVYHHSPVISSPITRHDSSPICDGAAAVILCPLDMVKDLSTRQPIRVLASATATDSIATANRRTLVELDGAKLSVNKAYQQAGLSPEDIDVFELHDAFTIVAAMSLEACGFAEHGKGTELAQNGDIFIDGKIPVSTMGGLKGRGHPVGATGAYELVDLVTQLRGEAGQNQVAGAEIGMAQNIGGTGATVVTHILGV
jgi:acetyl-CoA C-acetyltransferase